MIGLFIFNDYGLGVDETIQWVWGNEYFDLITKKETPDIYSQGKYYGPFFQIILAFQEHIFDLQDSREIFLSYHLTTFLFSFMGVVVFFFLNQAIFKNWRLSLLACAMLILSPRIFAESFYNPKDTPPITLFIICAYTLVLVLRKPNFLFATLHGIASAAAMDVRITGIMIPALTMALFGLSLLFVKESRNVRFGLIFITYLAVTFCFTILFWPMLYFDLGIFIESL